jgi:hypothetical protein
MWHEQGFCFVCSGDHYVAACVKSAESIKKVMPGASITVFTDEPSQKFPTMLFDNILSTSYEKTLTYSIKPECIPRSPYERTIFLDCDTYICKSLDQVFKILDLVDIAMPFAWWRYGEIMPALSSSMIVFKKSVKVAGIFQAWRESYSAAASVNPKIGDQDFLTDAVYKSSARYHILPPEYHAHCSVPHGFHGDVFVITNHAYHLSEKISAHLNSSKFHRIYVPHEKMLIVDNVEVASDVADRSVTKTLGDY